MTRDRVTDVRGAHHPESATDDRAEHARLVALSEYDLTELTGDPELEAVVRLAARVCDAPVASVNIVTETRLRRLAAVGIEGDCPREEALCAYAVTGSAPILVSDARGDPRFAGNPFVDGRKGRIRFYAAGRLIEPGGPVLGTLAVMDTRQRSLTPRQQRLFDDLTRITMDILQLHRRTRLLAGALRAVRLTGQELERSNTALGRLADQIGHELKAPLDGLRDQLRHVGERPAVRQDGPADRGLAAARTAADRMSEVIDAVLDRASLARRLRIVPVDLGAMVGAVLDELESDIRAARARVTVGRLPTVSGDADQLRAVMQTLIWNALRHRHPRRLCKVQITGERVSTGWVIRVADNGIGIPPGQRYEALQLLPRRGGTARDNAAPDEVAPDKAAPDSTAGSGTARHEAVEHGADRGTEYDIGLAACRGVIEAHQGDLSLEDTPGGGTTVVIHLPVPVHGATAAVLPGTAAGLLQRVAPYPSQAPQQAAQTTP